MDTLPPHPISLDAAEYLRSGTDKERERRLELHALATKMLGSSYFVERTKGFREWKATRKG